MDRVYCEVLLKKKQHLHAMILTANLVILSANIVNGCDGAVGVKYEK